MAKLNLSNTLLAGLLPIATVMVEGSGKLWDSTRDAFVLAAGEFPAGKDAAAAVRQVITDNLKANPKSVASYLQTCVWLADNGHDTARIATMSMGDATNARYPKAGEPGYLEAAAKKDKEATAKREAAEREALANQSPRGILLTRIARALADRDEVVLELIADEIDAMLAALDSEAAPVEAETEQEAEAA
jgi:hypothetical protein